MTDKNAIAQTIDSLVTAQIAYWVARQPSSAYSAQSSLNLNETRDDIFVYRFCGDSVELLPKPGIDWDRPHGAHVRAPWYLSLFRMVIDASAQRFYGLLTLSLEDLVEDNADVPIFAFQKPYGSKLILLPDIDTLSFNFYEDTCVDDMDYTDKAPSGIFIGATTGMAHTEASVVALESQRLRSGVFFRDRPEVDFRLPVVCQCMTPEAETAIRALGFGTAPGDWTDQLKHKFLLTMDGNGATCSRVVISLKSNSVPIKYTSSHQLYYFSALTPWVHYVPAYSDDDVLTIIRAERKRPGLFSAVAARGNVFYRDFLTREPTLRYTERLLSAYFDCFAETHSNARIERVAGNEAIALSGIGHLANMGDVAFEKTGWIGEPGSGRALEGFQIDPAAGAQFRYRIVDGAGRESGWTESGAFVGERGVSLRLTGFAVEGVGATRFVYYGRFLDGKEVGPITDGRLCTATEGTSLEAVRVVVVT